MISFLLKNFSLPCKNPNQGISVLFLISGMVFNVEGIQPSALFVIAEGDFISQLS
jgi:hypothetical protein